jgi:hypothetical protein
MSTHVQSNIASILTNIQGQKANIEANLAAASQAALVVEADIQAAIDLLVERYTDVQVIGKIIGAQMALKQLEAASKEVAVLEHALTVAAEDKAFVAKIVQSMNAQLIRENATG